MQGFNMGRYVPPDVEGQTTGNKLHKKHPLGARASKLASTGALTVRFEMPFAVWCSTCPQPTLIGQGVRFNAAKQKVGAYHSTPIYAFRMRHAACGGTIEIRTDPANTAYVVVSGGRRRDGGEDRRAGESIVGDGFAIATEGERAAARDSAFAKLEKTIADRAALAGARERIDELEGVAARQWEDPYARNQRLRRSFREGRAVREKDAARTEELKDRMSLGLDLLPASEEDARRAALVDFGGTDPDDDLPARRALSRPLFGDASKKASSGAGEKDKAGGTSKAGKLKSEFAASKMKESLVSEIVGNTRMAKDPFLDFGAKEASKNPARLPGLKRKRAPEEAPDPPEPGVSGKTTPAPALVSYDSDSD